jgi:hypothetical protein
MFLTIFFFVLLSGCDMFSGERPYNYPPAKWVSEKPKIWFEIGEPNNDPSTPIETIYGFLVLGGRHIEIEVFFNKGNGVSFYKKGNFNDGPYTRGTCKFSSDKLVVNIDKERDNYFNGLCETITFIRVPEWVFQIVSDAEEQTDLEMAE